jgi:hypothetical protein
LKPDFDLRVNVFIKMKRAAKKKPAQNALAFSIIQSHVDGFVSLL